MDLQELKDPEHESQESQEEKMMKVGMILICLNYLTVLLPSWTMEYLVGKNRRHEHIRRNF